MSRDSWTDDHGRWHIQRAPDDTPAVIEVLARLEADVAAGNRLPPSAAVLGKFVDSARRDDNLPSRNMLTSLIKANQAGLTRDDRLELAQVILRDGITSWNQLDNTDCRRLHDALDGFAYVAHLHIEKGMTTRYGACPAVGCPMRKAD